MTGVKILVAGDKSHAGKSTISLGLLAALIEAGYQPSELAYIKPATQCVSSTLTARFCQSKGIAYKHIGPVVFYRGFTRDALDRAVASPDEPSEQFPEICAEAVESISYGKRLTLIDGVGYPSVGSIIGCSSADIAIACRSPVLIVGRPGVGDAVDSFNLCAAVFESHRIPVLGAIFNKLQPSGFYSRDKCELHIRKYMALHRPRQRVYGLLPLHSDLAGLAGEETCGFAYKHPPEPEEAGVMTLEDEGAVKVVAQLFKEHVDTRQLVADLIEASTNPAAWVRMRKAFPGTSAANTELGDNTPGTKRSRDDGLQLEKESAFDASMAK